MKTKAEIRQEFYLNKIIESKKTVLKIDIFIFCLSATLVSFLTFAII